MSDTGSVSGWIEAAKRGDESSVRMLWERYRERAIGLARMKLQGSPRRAADEEDVALSAFARFCLGAKEGRFPDLENRDDLWRLLAKITVQKSLDHAKNEKRLKRGGGAVRGDSAFQGSLSESGMNGIDQILCSEPTPEQAASFAEECGNLLESLGPTVESTPNSLQKLEGYTNAQIAERHDCSLSSIKRALQLIRKKWEEWQS